MMLQIPIRRVATLFLVAAMAALLAPALVLAHAELETATPADKSTVTEPVAEVSGIYSEAMTPDGSSLVVKDASGATVAQGTVDPEDDTRMVATPSAPLGNGTYTVESTAHLDRRPHRARDVDLHGRRRPDAVAHPGRHGRPERRAPHPRRCRRLPFPRVAPTPVPSADGSSTGSGSDVLLPIIVALIILGAGAAYLLSRRNRPTRRH